MSVTLVALAILFAFLCGVAFSAAVLATVAMVNGTTKVDQAK